MSTSAEKTGMERRTATRYGCAGAAEVVSPGRGLHYPARIVNLSAGGCFLETSCPLERGSTVEVWMCAEGLPLRLAANLLLRRDGGVAFRFLNVSGRKMDQIEWLMAELAREAEAQRAKEG